LGSAWPAEVGTTKGDAKVLECRLLISIDVPARLRFLVATMVAGAACVACGGATVQIPAAKLSPRAMAELWIDPGREARDLKYGIGGARLAPNPDAVYRLKSKDEAGFSSSYDVVAPDGTEWSVKIGPEAQTEVVMSRILWALGYHQPPVYYLPKWTLNDGEGTETISEARFRIKLPALKRLDEPWTWQDNPFVGTAPHNGLLVVLLMFNSTDLKNSNNVMYRLEKPWDGASRWFVVRDLGASLGETGKLFPRRNDLPAFEKEGFVEKVENGRLEFAYKGRHKELLSILRPSDVRWAAERLSRLTDREWHEAFRAANYADPIADRYLARIKEKIAFGLTLRRD
jgi:hypothetical protein